MDIERLKEILNRIQGVRVAVIGDYCVDAYWTIDRSLAGLSHETGKTTLPVRTQRYGLGGAGNIVSNLEALDVDRIYAVGVACRDMFGLGLFRLLAAAGVETSGMILQDEDWSTPVYGKTYMEKGEQNRLDFGVCNQILPRTEQRVLQALENVLPSVHSVVINQQLAQGIHSDRLIEGINRFVEDHPEKDFIVDSRIMSERFRKVIYRLNAHEAARLCGESIPTAEGVPLDDAIRYALQIEAQSGKPAFISRGAGGSLVCCEGNVESIPAVPVGEEIDPVGAGDTTASALACAMAAGASPVEASRVANLASAVSVLKLRTTGTASPEEIISMLEQNPHWNHAGS